MHADTLISDVIAPHARDLDPAPFTPLPSGGPPPPPPLPPPSPPATMTAFRLSYLFYVGIILPTVVTLALFVFFVICWRKQSARKMVLTKPYDPHGTMRKLGIPNTPPPPPLFLHPRGGLITPTSELGGEDNAAYDMSRSPSAEAGATAGKPGGRPAPFQGGSPLCVQLDSSIRQLQLHTSPSGELELTGRLAFHSHVDSGLSEPACESPGAVSQGGGGVGAGGVGGVSSRDRPQSQASHSSHSTDSEDSGFRSARSGQLSHQGHYEPPMLRRSRSAKRGKGRGCYHRAATSSPDSDTEPSLPLTPTALWSNANTTPHHHPTITPHHPHTGTCHHHQNHHPYHHHHQHHQCSPDHLLHSGGGGEETVSTNIIGLDVTEADTSNLGWKYLQELSSPGHKVKEKASGLGGPGKGLTCQQSMTLAQVHTSHDLDNPDILGFSVV